MRTESDNSFAIVGIGAPAGGSEALEVLLRRLPSETRMAFVLVQHVDTGQPGLMPELLARYTRIPIQVAEDGIRVEANHLYVTAPNVTWTIKGGVLQTTTPFDHVKVLTPIDTFLRSLAEDQTVHAVGLVLCGAGSDGLSGLKAIKEQGGVTMVQSSPSAEYESMRLGAISTVLIDYTLALEEIPAKLIAHAQYLENLRRSRSIQNLQEEDIELALAQSQKQNEFLAGIIRNASQPLAIGYADGKLGLVNTAFEKLTGYSAEELHSIGWVGLTPPEFHQFEWDMLAEQRRTGLPIRYEKEYLRKDGTRVPIELLVHLVSDSKGEPEYYYSFVTDITDRRLAEEQLRQSEARYRTLFESMSEGFAIREIVFDEAGRACDLRYVSVNPAFEAQTGLKAADVVGRTTRELFPSAEPLWWDRYEKVVRTGEPASFDAWFSPLNRWYDVRAYRLSGHRLAVLFSDITDRKRTEEALGRREAELRTITANIPDVIARFDRESRHVFVNSAVTLATGLAPEAFIGKTNREMNMPAALCDQWDAAIAESFKSGKTQTFSFSYDSPHGRRHFETKIVPEHVADGQGQFALAVARDVTAAWQASEELARAKETAEAASKSKDHFLAVLSHELRTPLAPVLTTAELLASDASLSTDQREMVQMIRRNVELEARLIDDLLDVTRITQNKLDLRTELIDAHRKISLVIDICGGDAAAKQIVIETDLSAAQRRIHADPARFQQILWNILKNAIKFTPPLGRVSISTRNPTPDRIAIRVRDTGIGISPDAISHIFDAFEQGSREVTQKFGGLGLGLAITKALIQLHGGTITVASEGRNKGATFVVEMPVDTKSAQSQPLAKPAQLSRLECAILLVEDHPDTRKVMARLLSGLGCAVTTAGTVAEALEAAEKHTFTLVISDLGLPDAMGTELMRELKRRYKLKGVALSGYGMDEDLVKSAEAGFDAHLFKPVNLQLLEDTVRRIIAEC